eukprot:GHUV01038543.1.p1 GENE.GHUV01038543.1~~GHUV01038543.1.p1  ORF type:complete len:111 (+),score=33.08 GHUV01038543.1:256-588(+)
MAVLSPIGSGGTSNMPLLLPSSLAAAPAVPRGLLETTPLPVLLAAAPPCFHAILAAYHVLTRPSASCAATDVMHPPRLKLPSVCKAAPQQQQWLSDFYSMLGEAAEMNRG